MSNKRQAKQRPQFDNKNREKERMTLEDDECGNDIGTDVDDEGESYFFL